jgi:hypothetical protein
MVIRSRMNRQEASMRLVQFDRFDMVSLCVVFLVPLLASRPTCAQTARPVTEIGLHLVTLRVTAFEESPVGVGAGFARDVLPFVSIDGELNHFPENPSGNFGETEELLGVKLGTRSDQIGLFAKLRPGVIHFGGGFFDGRLTNRTRLAVDLGVVLERYSRSGRWGWRLDGGDTVIPFGADSILLGGIPPTRQPGTTHNFQLLAGLVVEFQ